MEVCVVYQPWNSLCITRACLRCAAPLDRPRSVYKSDVECRFVSQNGQMTLKVMVNASHFQFQLRESQDAYLVQIWWFWLKSIKSYCADKSKFLEFLVKMAKMTLKVKVNDFHFQYQLRVSQNACLGANLVIVAHIYNELSHGQSQSQWPPFSILAESIPWCMFGAT